MCDLLGVFQKSASHSQPSPRSLWSLLMAQGTMVGLLPRSLLMAMVGLLPRLDGITDSMGMSLSKLRRW